MYVDSFILPLPTKNLAAYKKMAAKVGKLYRTHGALSYTECIADDVQPGKVTSFPQSVKAKADETVVIAFVTYKSRKERDAVTKKVMADPYMANFDPKAMPFDGKRMFWGGFKPLVEL